MLEDDYYSEGLILILTLLILAFCLIAGVSLIEYLLLGALI